MGITKTVNSSGVHKKRIAFAILLTVLAVIFLPDFHNEKMNNAFQYRLWTSDSDAQSFAIRLGGTIGNIVEWKRMHFGFPTSAITIDLQPECRILQARVEMDYIVINFIISGIVIGAVWLIFSVLKKIVKRVAQTPLKHD